MNNATDIEYSKSAGKSALQDRPLSPTPTPGNGNAESITDLEPRAETANDGSGRSGRSIDVPSFVRGYLFALQIIRPDWQRKRETINRYERTAKRREKVNAKHRDRYEKSKENATLHCSRWDELEDALLLEKASSMTYRQLAKEFGRTHYAIETRLRKLRDGG